LGKVFGVVGLVFAATGALLLKFLPSFNGVLVGLALLGAGAVIFWLVVASSKATPARSRE
jgi:hypothetical protein